VSGQIAQEAEEAHGFAETVMAQALDVEAGGSRDLIEALDRAERTLVWLAAETRAARLQERASPRS
jgi:hypothetical protein